jgi:hypothetical protein
MKDPQQSVEIAFHGDVSGHEGTGDTQLTW